MLPAVSHPDEGEDIQALLAPGQGPRALLRSVGLMETRTRAVVAGPHGDMAEYRTS
jgi:hypothetical protein